MSLLRRRLMAAVVLLLAATMVTLLTLRGLGVPIALGPFASPTPVVATDPTPDPSPAVSVDPAVVFAEIEAQVREGRMLPGAPIGVAEVISRDELAERLSGLLLADWSIEERAADNLTLRGLGLLAPGQDIVELTERLYAGQVLGYYDSEADQMVVVSDAGIGPAVQISYAHEYTHALADAAFDLSAAADGVDGEYDRELALLSLTEGDATTAMVLWALDQLSVEELLGVSQVPVPDAVGIPAWMIRELEFPYTVGAQFVARLVQTGGWDAVDAAYADPPTSSEQVLHYEKYATDEPPVTVTAPDLDGLSAALGGSWRQVQQTTLGEAWIGLWLEAIGGDSRFTPRAAAGWGGDRISVMAGDDGAWAIAWRVAWDVPLDVTEFVDVYDEVRADLPFPAAVEMLGDRELVIVHASSAAVLAAATSLLAR